MQVKTQELHHDRKEISDGLSVAFSIEENIGPLR